MSASTHEFERLDRCPLCKNTELKPLKGYENNFLAKCRSCSLVFSNRVPKKEELDEIYNNYNYDSAGLTEASKLKRENIANYILSKGNISKVLDVGCGKGEWLDIFRDKGCITYGTEYNENLSSFAKAKEHIILDGGMLPNLDTKVDLIIFTEVIEHIQNPIQVLEQFKELLSDRGMIYLTTPNFSAPERYILKEDWGVIKYPEHLVYFTPRTLDLALRSSGYNKHKLYSENISIFRIMQSMSRNGKDPEVVSDGFQRASQNYSSISLIKSFVNLLLNFFGIGVSVVAIYHKAN
jgi:2-polyprenyl-3-methyl-5-hydroxy-6-metoxy-1,4-benzoquinol methylase